MVFLLNLPISIGFNELKAENFNWISYEEPFVPVSRPKTNELEEIVSKVRQVEGAVFCLCVGHSDEINQQILNFCKQKGYYFYACRLNSRFCSGQNCTILDRQGVFYYRVINGRLEGFSKPRTSLQVPIYQQPTYMTYNVPQSYYYSSNNYGSCVSGNCSSCR